MRALSTAPGNAASPAKWRRPLVLHTILAGLAGALSLVAHVIPAAALEVPRGELKVSVSNTRANTMLLTWSGPIMAPMANQIKDAFESRKGQATRFMFRISSYGGSVAEGERVIEVLRQIKATHELETAVTQGDVCASMCVFIYVQGQKRYGALTSSWLFHEVSHMDPVTKQTTKLDRAAWERLVDRYLRPAGVSDAWIADLKPRTIDSDYWQTGADLITSNSGIIHESLANQTARYVAPSPRPRETASAQPAASSPRDCRKYFPSIGAVVAVPCS
jgi:ATP-dependent protease ClpP protease subunit